MHHEEIELFKQMVDGSIKEKGMDIELINLAFPNLIRNIPQKKSLTDGRKVTKEEYIQEVKKEMETLTGETEPKKKKKKISIDTYKR